MKLAIVGAGMIVGDFLQIAKELPDIELVSIVGTVRSQEKVRNIALEHNIGRATTNYDDVLTATDIDTIYVALPNYLHYEYTKRALLAGKNVICEKPFTLKLEELEELAALAKEKNVILLEAITNQYLETFHYIKDNLSRLGDIKIVACNYSQYSSRYDNFKKGIIAPAFDVNQGGGALLDLNIYNIHLVVGLFGSGLGANYKGNIERDVDTSGVLTIDYPDKAVVCIAAKDCSAEIRSTIQGTLGSITIYGGTNTMEKVVLQLNDGTIEEATNKHNHRMYNEFIKFAEVIKNKDLTFANTMLEHSLAVMKVIENAKNN